MLSTGLSDWSPGRRAETVRAQAPRSPIPHWVGALIAVYFATFVFEGPLRWALSLVGAGGAIYLRDAVLIVLILRGIGQFVWGARASPAAVVAALLLTTGLVLSIAFGIGLPQLAFGAKLIMPAVVAFIYGPDLLDDRARWQKVPLLFVCLTAAGVLADKFLELPWEGLVLQVGGASVSVGKIWYAGEFQRISGFARTSYDAAIFAFLYFVLVADSLRRSWLLVLWLLVVTTVVLTTTKGMILALVVVTFLELVRLSGERIWRSVSLVLCRLFIVIGIALPASSLLIRPEMNFDSSVERALLFSFYDRMANTWPDLFERFEGILNLLLGKGLGSVGAAQAYFDPYNYNPADNLYVYLLSTGGLLLAGLIAVVLWLAPLSSNARGRVAVTNAALLVSVYGVTTNLVDNPALCFVIGALAAVALKGRLSFELSARRKSGLY